MVRYEHEARAELVADDRMARALIPLLAHPSICEGVLRLTATTAWTRRNFVRWNVRGLPPSNGGNAAALAPSHVHRPRGVRGGTQVRATTPTLGSHA